MKLFGCNISATIRFRKFIFILPAFSLWGSKIIFEAQRKLTLWCLLTGGTVDIVGFIKELL